MDADTLTRSIAPDDVAVRPDGLVRILVVPWMTPAEVTDIRPDGQLLTYAEQFARGSLSRAEKAPNRVQLVWTHDDQFANLLGRGVAFDNDPAGEVGLFRLLPSVADKAREALEGSGVSMRFRPLKPALGSERSGQLVTRTEVHLVHAAAVDNPAYVDAAVLAVREANERAAEAARQRAESDALMVRALERLIAGGRDLSDVQSRWLADHTQRSAAG